MKSAILLSLPEIGAALATPPPQSYPTRPAGYELLRTPRLRSSVARAVLAAEAVTTAQNGESTRGGVVLSSLGFKTVTGTFVVPTADDPTSGPTAGNVAGLYSASFWIGIDGATSCPNASLRAGVDIFWDSGDRNYYAWYDWYPSQSTDFANFSASAGDAVRITAAVGPSNTAGTVTVENLSSGESASQSFVGEGSPLCQAEALWIVEDDALVEQPSYPVALANFTRVSFCGAGATTSAGEEIDLTGAQVLNIDLEEQGGLLTDCGLDSPSRLTCTRVVEAD